MSLSWLQEKLQYQFKDPAHLVLALTHCSHGGQHNERLEFLGDALVNFVAASLLFDHYPKATEGELTRWRSSLVSRDALAVLAKSFSLNEYMILGPGEINTGGAMRESILSCAMEAIIGAIYLDTTPKEAFDVVSAWLNPALTQLKSAAKHKDPKTTLQEYVQSKRHPLPVYRVITVLGQDHLQEFTVQCEAMSYVSHGKGSSRRRAEQAAAETMLALIHSQANERGEA